MANKLTEPYWVAVAKWHLYRKFRTDPRYATLLAFRKFLRQHPGGGLLVDCGANVGDVTALFLAKDFIVHAFEPDPLAAAVLQRRHGGSRNFYLHNAAVGAHEGRAKLYRPASNKLRDTTGSSLFRRECLGHDDGTEVTVIDLFSFIYSLDRPITVLKLDVEGAEVEILERMLDEGAHAGIGHVWAETHETVSPDFPRRLAAVRKRIADEGISNIKLDWI